MHERTILSDRRGLHRGNQFVLSRTYENSEAENAKKEGLARSLFQSI